MNDEMRTPKSLFFSLGISFGFQLFDILLNEFLPNFNFFGSESNEVKNFNDKEKWSWKNLPDIVHQSGFSFYDQEQSTFEKSMSNELKSPGNNIKSNNKVPSLSGIKIPKGFVPGKCAKSYKHSHDELNKMAITAAGIPILK